jgi:hypothetical protein
VREHFSRARTSSQRSETVDRIMHRGIPSKGAFGATGGFERMSLGLPARAMETRTSHFRGSSRVFRAHREKPGAAP